MSSVPPVPPNAPAPMPPPVPALPVSVIPKASLGVWITRIAIIVALLFGGIYLLDSWIAKRDAAQSAASQAALNTIVQDNRVFQQKALQQISDLEKQIGDLQLANSNLQSARTARAAQTAKQKQQDAKLTPDAAAGRLHELEPTQPTPTLNPDNTIAVGLPLTQAIIQDLDTIPQLKADNADLTQIVANDTTIITDLHTELTTKDGIITGLNNQITAQTTASKDALSAANAAARKGKLKWFAIGFVAGVVVREAILLGLGK